MAPLTSTRAVRPSIDLEDDDFDFDFDESVMRHVARLESEHATHRNSVKPESKGGSQVASRLEAAGPSSTKEQRQVNETHATDADDFDVGSDDALTAAQMAAIDQVDRVDEGGGPGFDASPLSAAVRNHAGPSSRPMQRTISFGKGATLKTGNRLQQPTMPSSSSSGRQLTLFGDVAQETATGLLIQARNVNEPTASQAPSKAKPHSARMSQTQRPYLSEGHRFLDCSDQRAKTKQWDFAQPVKVKRKPAFSEYEEIDLDDEEAADFLRDADADLYESEQFELPPDPLAPEAPQGLTRMKVQCDREAARTWIYPTNKERRDYQFNIVQRALFNNVLVALPTGLGKTFIAAVVILNYFRWFPEGKIIFVAPTKPLVSQQQVACHGICGLPWHTATEMTGEVKAQQRAEEWKAKRIFYMTPQTFENDLCSDLVNAEDIVCVVVDEAHHATGNYAYGKVIRHLMPRNPFFRVLALTATPGSRPEQVQEVIDSLHVNYIEIRSEASLDIRKYVRSKDEDQVVVPLSGLVAELRDKMVQLMRPSLDALVNAGLLKQKNPVLLQPFAVTAIYQDPRRKAIVNAQRLFHHVSDLAALARALEMLIRYSVNMFASRMFALETGSDPAARGKKATQTRQRNKYSQNMIVREMRQKYEDAQDGEGVVMHPKMEYLQNVIAAHFANEQESGRAASQTRVMVFCSLRECVTEIVTVLNRVNGVSATIFVGQSSDSKGNRGMTQKEQERIVREFKNGTHNVLVATSIGEEGLDIGEVDLSVNYEAVKNSTRMLQRDGRTGRKRDGRIVTLMSEGLEESNWQHSKDNYKSMQDDIIKGVNLQLFDDVERLVPDDISTVPVFQEVEQPEFEPSMIRSNLRAARKQDAAKRKRDSNPKRNVPKGAFEGFVRVSEMRKSKNSRKKRESIREADDEESSNEEVGESSCRAGPSRAAPSSFNSSDDDDDDAEISRGIVLSDFPSSSSRGAGRSALSSHSQPEAPRGTSRRSLGAGRPRQSDVHTLAPDTSSPIPRTGPLQESIKNGAEVSVDISPYPAKGKTRAIEYIKDVTFDASSPVIQSRRGPPHPLVARLAAQSSLFDDDDVVGPSKAKDISIVSIDDDDDEESADDSPVIRRGKRKLVRASKIATSSSPSASAMGPPPARPNQKTKSRLLTEGRRRTDKKKRVGDSPTSRRLFQLEADRSTDEEIHGEKDENDEGDDRWIEDSSDREHVGDFAPTQAPKGYNQNAVYMQSVHSQFDMTPFSKHAQMLRKPRRRVTDTPQTDNGSNEGEVEPDEYENDSFVCSDDESIVYASQNSTSALDSSQF